MKFFKAPDTLNYLNRFVSADGRWEIGHSTKSLAIAFNPVDAQGPTVTIYCGESRPLQIGVQMVVMTILESYPEDVNEWQVWQDFPQCEGPIDTDPCWAKLQSMAWRALGEKYRADAVLRGSSL
jgi:hypothetical protein